MVSIASPTWLKVSIAKESDRLQIARLCRRAVGRSDYVFRILPRIIARGGLFLAWDGNALVGMTNFDRSVDGSGWLGAARTDPDWRRRGVAVFLQRKIAAYAKRRGVRTLRLWVLSDNKPSIKSCESGGFKQVCEAVHVSCILKASKARRKVEPSFPSQSLLQSLLKSSYATKIQGYIGYRRHFMKLTEALLTRLRDDGEAYWIEDSVLLVSQPERTFGKRQSSSTILRGPLAKSLNRAKEIAKGMRANILNCYIPYNTYEISLARRLGFRRSPWGRHCLVFEKKL